MPPTLKKLDARFLDTHRLVFRFDGLYREQSRSADDRDNQIEKVDGGYREFGHPIFLCWRHDSAGLVRQKTKFAQRTKKNAAYGLP